MIENVISLALSYKILKDPLFNPLKHIDDLILLMYRFLKGSVRVLF